MRLEDYIQELKQKHKEERHKEKDGKNQGVQKDISMTTSVFWIHTLNAINNGQDAVSMSVVC